jgi:hypothetical protein
MPRLHANASGKLLASGKSSCDHECCSYRRQHSQVQPDDASDVAGEIEPLLSADELWNVFTEPLDNLTRAPNSLWSPVFRLGR